MELAGMKIPEHLSPSGLSTWSQCARRYWITYVEGRSTKQATVQTERGRFVHAVIEQVMWREPDERTLISARVIAARLWTLWTDFGANADFTALDLDQRGLDEFASWTWTSIERAFTQIDPPTVSVVAVELPVRLELGGVPFKGFIDLVMDDCSTTDNAIEVVDYKTGEKPEANKPWSKAQEHGKMAQPILYGAALRELGHRVTGVHLAHIPAYGRAGFMSAVTTDAVLDAAVEGLQGAWWEILQHVNDDGENITPTTSTLCGWCEFVGECPEGQQAVRERHAEGRNVGPALTTLNLGGTTP